MSRFSGFPSMQLESKYNKILYNAIFLLQLRVTKFLTGVQDFDDDKFSKVLIKLYTRLYSMEEIKNDSTKFSYAMQDLAL